MPPKTSTNIFQMPLKHPKNASETPHKRVLNASEKYLKCIWNAPKRILPHSNAPKCMLNAFEITPTCLRNAYKTSPKCLRNAPKMSPKHLKNTSKRPLKRHWSTTETSETPQNSVQCGSCIIVLYVLVWYIIWIVSSSPSDFHSEKVGLIRITYDPPVSISVDKYLKWLRVALKKLSIFEIFLTHGHKINT